MSHAALPYVLVEHLETRGLCEHQPTKSIFVIECTSKPLHQSRSIAFHPGQPADFNSTNPECYFGGLRVGALYLVEQATVVAFRRIISMCCSVRYYFNVLRAALWAVTESQHGFSLRAMGPALSSERISCISKHATPGCHTAASQAVGRGPAAPDGSTGSPSAGDNPRPRAEAPLPSPGGEGRTNCRPRDASTPLRSAQHDNPTSTNPRRVTCPVTLDSRRCGNDGCWRTASGAHEGCPYNQAPSPAAASASTSPQGRGEGGRAARFLPPQERRLPPTPRRCARGSSAAPRCSRGCRRGRGGRGACGGAAGPGTSASRAP